MSDWHLRWVGWPWWLVLPLAVAAVWGMRRWVQPELAGQPERARRALIMLRCAAVGLTVLLLLEPTFSKASQVLERPLVAVLLDRSGSMQTRDRTMALTAQLDEAVALGLVPRSQRPRATNATAQAQADARLATAATPGSAVGNGLRQWRDLSRFDRAWRLTREELLPALTNRARVKVFGFDQSLAPLDPAQAPPSPTSKETDPEAALTDLARQWSQETVGGVLVLSDGRQTAGRDPGPVARALRARGAVLAGVLVGDTNQPPDAVVAEVIGSSEVFLEETISLDVKYRITGDPQGDWDLALNQNGKEVDRHRVRGDGTWQYEHFEVPAKQPGSSIFQARLLPRKNRAGGNRPLRPGGAVARELWHGITGARLEDALQSGALDRRPDKTERLTSLASPSNVGENYVSRIRCYVFPPVSGPYRFWIASDDASRLWLGASADPAERTVIAAVTNFTSRMNWDSAPSQRSPPINLKVNQPYYLEVVNKQASGEDHVEVGWQLPDGSLERPIPATRLAAWPGTLPDADTPGSVAPGPGAPAQPFEEASLVNNQAEFTVAVNQDPIRAYLADATPRWESRYLAALFERDRRVKLERHYHSVTSGQQGVPLLPRTQQEWNNQDLVVLGDLDSSLLPPAQQQYAVDFVAKRGGFLVCVAGPRGMPRSFSLGVLANVLPVKVVSQTQRDTAPVTLSLTDTGRDHPITLVLKDPALNQRLWPALPPLQWIASSVAAKPAASVLLEAQNPVRTPMVALQRYGAGRVLWMGTGESWRWRDRLGDRVHQTFWLQAMRWGLGARLRGKDPRLQVSLDRALLAPGETAELRGRATLKNGAPAGTPLRVRLEQLDPGGAVVPESARTLEMQPVGDSADIWQQTLRDLAEGQWRATVTSPHPELAGLSETRELLVRPEPGREAIELSADPAGLARLSEAGGGRLVGLDQAGKLAQDLAARLKPQWREQLETYSLWDNYAALLVVLALLSVEWIWRKRIGLP